MKQTKKYIITALIAIAAIAAGVFAYQYFQKSASPAADKKFDRLQTAVSDIKLEKTDLDSIFYSESTGLFYQWDGQIFKEYPQETRVVQLNLSGDTLTFELHLTQLDGIYFGFGRAETMIVSYFVKAMNLPPCPVGNNTYNTADTLLLMLDRSKENIPQAERLYGDAFTYRLSDGAVIRQYLDDRLRPSTELGVKRDDYFGFTTELVQKSTELRMHFLTRAKYEPSTDPYRIYDLNSTEPSYYYAGYTADRLTLEDVILDYAYDTEGGIFHFKRGDGVFYSKIGTGSEADQTICTFQGDYVADYVRQKDYLVNTKEMRDSKSFTLTDARTGSESKFNLTHSYRDVTTVKMNTAGTKLVVLGEFDWIGPRDAYNLQLVTFVDLTTNEVTQYAGSALYDAERPEILFSGDTVFLFCDGRLCKFDFSNLS